MSISEHSKQRFAQTPPLPSDWVSLENPDARGCSTRSMAPRLRTAERGMVVTDGGNLIYDMASGKIEDPTALAAALKSVTGVVDHGLFLDLADEALVGTDEGVVRLQP